jgi:serine/threonine protein kinase
LQDPGRMFLSPGVRLGPYQILEPIGSGGMGEVYRAVDVRLERIVAVKVLPAHLSRDNDLRQRFEQEAKAVSVLNHPNICTLHDVGREGDTDYLVMEFVDGRTLSSRLDRGPLSVDELLRYAIQMADALDKAHRKGIVHRDLKPGNVMLTKSGVKLVDFGLAKVVVQSPSAASSFETEERDLTQEGTLLGTLHYMSPEQLEGKEVDARSDIFSFGAVLYEMATGHRAFEGSSAAGIIAAILKEEPKPITVALPPGLDRLIRACLQKHPDDRRQSTHDIAGELQSISENRSYSGVSIEAPRVTKWKSRARTFAILAILTLGLLAAGSFLHTPTISPSLRSNILLPPGFQLDAQNRSLALSPDGQSLVFAGTDADGATGLWLRRLDQSDARRISGTDDGTYPFWSPDSRFIGFFADGKLKKAAAAGGITQTICEAPDGRGGTWNQNDIIVFAPYHSGGLYQIPASGGQLTQLTKPDEKNNSHRLPNFLPDGKNVLFYNADVENQVSNKAGVYNLNISSREIVPILLEKTEASYATPGYLTFVRDGKLMAQQFNPRSMKFTGPATAIAQNVQFYVERYTGAYSVSQNYLIFLAEDISPLAQLTWFDIDGRKIGSVGKKSRFSSLLLSPDEKRVLTTYTQTQSRDLWVYDLNIGSNTRLTFKQEPYFETGMAWSPDGNKIAYGDIDGKLFTMNSDSGLTAQALLRKKELTRWWPTDWSSDGEKIILGTYVSKTGTDIGVLSLKDESIQPFQASEHNETSGAFSSDEKWIGYVSDESGRNELYVVPYPGPGGKWQISTDGVTEWKWVDEGRHIYYLSPDRTLHSVDINMKGSVIQLGPQTTLFGGQAVPTGFVALSKDGKRLLISVPTEELRESGLTLVQNWSKELSK